MEPCKMRVKIKKHNKRYGQHKLAKLIYTYQKLEPTPVPRVLELIKS